MAEITTDESFQQVKIGKKNFLWQKPELLILSLWGYYLCFKFKSSEISIVSCLSLSKAEHKTSDSFPDISY